MPRNTPPTRRPHDADTMPEHDVVSPTVAAQRLGVTPDAVRARLRRGTLAGERTDGDWQVFLPHVPASDVRHDADTMPTADRHDGDTTAQPDRTQELIASQREEIVFLREQLDHSRRELSAERERFDVIHREALSRIEALTAGDDQTASESRVMRQDAPGATIGENANNESLNAPAEPSKRGFSAWWVRIFGS